MEEERCKCGKKSMKKIFPVNFHICSECYAKQYHLVGMCQVFGAKSYPDNEENLLDWIKDK